jgi:MYXO-CTERM domain-containing protein
MTARPRSLLTDINKTTRNIVMKLNRLFTALLTLVGFATAATAAPFGGAYYETFAGSEIVAIDLANPSLLLGIKTGNISNVAVGGDTVYYQDGRQIFAGNANLSSTSLFHTNGAVATDLAINVAGNAYYESFGTEIVAIELANPSHLLGIRTGNITNISVSGGKVYYQDGIKIFVGNADLSSVSLFHTNGVAPTDLAVDADNNVYYESFGDEIVAIELANPSHLLGIRTGNITNIMVGDGNVYFQEGLKIWRGNRDLSTVSLFHTNGAVAADIALMPPARPVFDVDEPPSLGLLALGIVVAGGLRPRRRSAA